MYDVGSEKSREVYKYLYIMHNAVRRGWDVKLILIWDIVG
jgi:hypothetical protein